MYVHSVTVSKLLQPSHTFIFYFHVHDFYSFLLTVFRQSGYVYVANKMQSTFVIFEMKKTKMKVIIQQ